MWITKNVHGASYRGLHWLEHVLWMEDGRITKDNLYRDLIAGMRNLGHPSYAIGAWSSWKWKLGGARHGPFHVCGEVTCIHFVTMQQTKKSNLKFPNNYKQVLNLKFKSKIFKCLERLHTHEFIYAECNNMYIFQETLCEKKIY